MAGRRKDVLEIREMVRRFRLGERDRRIARDLATSRNTVAKYRAWALKDGFLAGEYLQVPGSIKKRLEETGSAEKNQPGLESLVEAHRAFFVEKRAAGVEVTALFGLLRERDSTWELHDTPQNRPEARGPGGSALPAHGWLTLSRTSMAHHRAHARPSIGRRVQGAWLFEVDLLSFSAQRLRGMP